MSARAPYIHLTSPQLFADDLSQIKQTVDEVLRPRFEELMRELPLSTIEQERDDRNAARHDAIYAQNRAFHLSLRQAQETTDSAEPVQQPPDRFKVPEGFERIKAYATRHGVTGQYVKIRLREHIIKVPYGLTFIYAIKCDTPMPVKSGRGWWRRKTKDAS